MVEKEAKTETVFYCGSRYNVLAWIGNGLDFVDNKMMVISMACDRSW